MAPAKQQFNVNLAPDLIRRIKHHAVDAQLSLSDLLAHLLEAHLARIADPTDPTEPTDPAVPVSPTSPKENAMPQQRPALTLQPMIHVEDMAAAVSFYEALGGSILHGSRDGDFVLLQIGAGQLSLLAHPPNPDQNEGTVELNFETGENLHDLETRLAAAGINVVQPTTDEGFGRQLQIATPDGLLVKINELQPDLYT